MRLIDADALLSEFGEEPYVWNDDAWEIQANDDYKYYKELVEKASAVDVTPVVHGRWITSGKEVCEDIQYFCSVCNQEYWETRSWPNRTHFCPNCGANMRGTEDELQ